MMQAPRCKDSHRRIVQIAKTLKLVEPGKVYSELSAEFSQKASEDKNVIYNNVNINLYSYTLLQRVPLMRSVQ